MRYIKRDGHFPYIIWCAPELTEEKTTCGVVVGAGVTKTHLPLAYLFLPETHTHKRSLIGSISTTPID